MEAQQLAGLPRFKSKRLCGRFLWGASSGSRSFSWSSGGSLFSAIQLQDRKRPGFPRRGALSRFFLLSYSRLRSSPSTWICAPLVSVLANSESLP